MKKSWFIALVTIITLILLAVGLYFFFPSFSKSISPIVNSPLFGDLVDENGNPITSPGDQTGNEPTDPNNTEAPIEAVPGFKAFKIGDYEVSSVQALDFKISETETKTLLVSVGKGSGVVRIYDPELESTAIVGTISIPNIIRSEFTANGSYVVVQSQELDSLKTFILKSDPRTPTEDRFFSPVFNSVNVDSFFVDGNTIYFVEKTRTGADIYEYVPASNKRTLIFRGIFNNIYGFAQNGIVFIGTKPATGTTGFLFKLDKVNATVTKIASGSAIIASKGHTADNVLITEFLPTNSFTRILDTKTKQLSPVGIKTLKEKCTPDLSTKTLIFCGGTLEGFEKGPDSWYMGGKTFNDTLYFINEITREVSSLADTDEYVDVIYPSSSPYSGIITFINKKDISPWIVISK